MNPQEASTAVARMFAAHGMTKAPEVAGEMTREVMSSSCGICALGVIEENRKNGTRPHTVPTFRGAYHAASTSVAHGLHAGQTSATDVGAVEGHWRGEITRAIERATGQGRAWSSYMAARMWASGAVTPSMAVDEASDPVWTKTMPERVTDDLIEIAYTYARACATRAPADYSDEEWGAIAKPWAAALARVSA